MTSSKRPKMAIVGPNIFFTQHVLLGFRFQNNKSWTDGKPLNQGVLGRKYLKNLVFGFPRVPAQIYGKGLKICFSLLCIKPVCFSVLTKSKKQIRIRDLHQVLDFKDVQNHPKKQCSNVVFFLKNSLRVFIIIYIVSMAKTAIW